MHEVLGEIISRSIVIDSVPKTKIYSTDKDTIRSIKKGLLGVSPSLSYRAEYFNKSEQMHSAIYKKLKYNENDKISIKISEN
jgi:hypothetical protein